MVEVILICAAVAVGIALATRIDSEPKRPPVTGRSAGPSPKPPHEPAD